jgi:ABC-type transporter Mla subunit MlaD
VILSFIALAVSVIALIYVLWSGHVTRRMQRQTEMYRYLTAARAGHRRRSGRQP